MVNALALGADEGRDERRYATGSSKYTVIHGSPNEETLAQANHTLYEGNAAN